MSDVVEVLSEVFEERARQDEKWGEQNHPDGTGGPLDVHVVETYKFLCERATANGSLRWQHILQEEVAEVCAATGQDLRGELIQVAAVCVAWVECIDRRAR